MSRRRATLGLLCATLSLGSGGARAASTEPATSPTARLAALEALDEGQGSWVEERHDALLQLLAYPETREQAGRALVRLLLEEPPRRGWFTTYSRLREEPSTSRAERDALALRQAWASPDDATSLRRAASTLDAASAAARATPEARRARAHLALLRGEPEAALAALHSAERGSLEGIYALLALGREREVKSQDPELPAAVAEALLTPTVGNRASALAAASYLRLATRLVGDASTCLHAACVTLAELESARGEHWRAAQAWRAWRSAAPDDRDAQVAQVQELLDAGELGEAREAAEGRSELTARVEAVSAIQGIPRPPQAEQDEAIALAFARSGDAWQVRLARGQVLLRTEQWEAAWLELRSVLADRPQDTEALWGAALAGARAGHPREALALWERAVAMAPSPSARAPLARDLANVQALMAEQHKLQGDLAAARQGYVVAVTMQPSRSELWAALGGVLWATDPLDARQAYMGAVQLDPNNLGALASAAKLSIQLGDLNSAALLLARAPKDSTDPDLVLAREALRIAPALAEARAAGSADPVTGARALERLYLEYAADAEVVAAIAEAWLALDRPGGALQAFLRLAELEPGSGRARLGEIRCRVALGQLKEATALVHAAEREALSTADQAAVQDLKLVLARARGDDAQARGALLEARAAYVEALEMAPRDGWAWRGLGALFLADHQPDLAYAYFEVALGSDSDARLWALARQGEVQALIEAGRWDQAARMVRELRVGSHEPTSALDLFQQVHLAMARDLIARGDLSGARAEQALLAARGEHTPAVKALEAELLLAEGDGSGAWNVATGALTAQPDSTALAELLRRLGVTLDRSAEAASRIEAAVLASRSEPLRRVAEQAALDALFAHVDRLQRDGRTTEARRVADEIRALAQGKADDLSLLGGVYLDLGLGYQADEVYQQALQEAPDHTPALLGRAAALAWQGRVGEAERWLAEAYARTGNRDVGLALADLQTQRNRLRAARETLASLGAADSAQVQRGGLEPVPLPDGKLPARWDTSPAAAALPSPSYLSALHRLEAEERREAEGEQADATTFEGRRTVAEARARQISVRTALGLGAFHQAGTAGETWIAGAFGLGAVAEIPLGPITLMGDAVPVYVTDFEDLEDGVGVDYGMRLRWGPLNGEARLGSSVIGAGAGAYLTWLGRLGFSRKSFSLGLDAAHAPVTDTLTSWVGKWDDETGEFFGLARRTWLGGFAGVKPPGGFDAGMRLRLGQVTALQMTPEAFSELTLWAGRSFERGRARFRSGGVGTWTRNERQIEEFVVGEAGVFSPETYASAFLTLNAGWQELGGLDFCLGARLGAETLIGEESPYVSPGVHPATDLHAVADYHLGERWTLSGSAAWQTTAFSWSAMGGVLALSFHAPEARPTLYALPELYGDRPVRIATCGE